MEIPKLSRCDFQYWYKSLIFNYMTGGEWQQGHYSSLFDGCSQSSLMLGTGSGNTAGQYFPPFRDKMP